MVSEVSSISQLPATNRAAEWLVQTLKQVLSKSSISPRAAVQEFVMQYGYQIRMSIDILLPPHTGTSQGKQTREGTKSAAEEVADGVAPIYSVGMPCYDLYCGSRHVKDARWVPAVVIKVFGTWSVNVGVFPQGGTWRRHVEQLHPHYGAEEDSDTGKELSAHIMEPFPLPPTTEVVTTLPQSSTPNRW